MLRPLGATNLSDGSVDVDGDGVGDYCPFGANCDYDGPDSPTGGGGGGGSGNGGNGGDGGDGGDDGFWKGLLDKASTGFEILAGVVDAVRGLAQSQADKKFSDDLSKASDKMNAGRDGMIQAGEKIDSASSALFGENQNITSLANSFSDITSTINSQISQLNALASTISSLSQTATAQAQAYADAQARLDYAMNRANYPAGGAGLKQQRTDAQSARSDMTNISISQLNTQNSLSGAVNQSNTIGSAYNQNLSTQSGIRSDLVSAYDRAQTFQNALNGGVADYNNSAKVYSSGVNDVRSASTDRQNTYQNTLTPMAESSNGLRGAGQVISAVNDGQYATATSKALQTGLNQALISGAPAELSLARGLAGAVLDGAGKAVDQKSGMLGFAQAVGDATIRVSDMVRVGQAVDLASTIMSNSNNPNRVYDASQVLTQQVGRTVEIGGTIAQTVSSVLPGAQGAGPIINGATKALAPTAQGLAQTTVEAVNQLAQGKVFGNLTPGASNLSAFPVGGRDIGNRPAGYTPGSTGALQTAVVGSLVSIGKGAEAVTVGLVQNNRNFAMEASAVINSMANTGLPKSGSNTQVTIRPAYTGD